MSPRIAFLASAGALVASVLALCPSFAFAASYRDELKRYPYLTDVVNAGTAGYATVNWATARSATTGSVRHGMVGADGSCTPLTSVAATRTTISVNSVSHYQWKAKLTLAPDTEYCYRTYLGAVDLLGLDSSPRFHTQVAGQPPGGFKFAVLGDWGYTDSSGANPHQANVIQQIAQSGARFALTTGDQPYGSGSQTNWGDLVTVGSGQSTVFGPSFWKVAGASIPLFPALGNHGLYSTYLANWPQDRAVQASGGRYQMDTYCCLNGTSSKSYPSAWYAFDAGRARFYVLDTAWASSNIGTGTSYKNDYDYHWTPTSDEYKWLQADLEAHPSTVKFAFFHYPLYSDNPTEPSDTLLRGAGSLEGLLSRNGVDIAFNGHAHTYQRNLAPTGGLLSYLTGGGGAKLAPIGPCSAIDAYGIGWSNSSSKGSACGGAPRPASIDRVYHFLLVTVDGTRVTVSPTDELGRSFDEQTYDFSAPPDPEPPGAATLRFSPEADARVEEASPDSSYGASTRLYVDNSPMKESHLSFTVSGVSGSVKSARLRLFAYGGSVDGPAVYGTAGGWTEAGLTWANRPPPLGGPSDDERAVAAGTWVELDVTALVTGNGSYSFRVAPTSSDGVDFYSREFTSDRPELVLDVE